MKLQSLFIALIVSLSLQASNPVEDARMRDSEPCRKAASRLKEFFESGMHPDKIHDKANELGLLFERGAKQEQEGTKKQELHAMGKCYRNLNWIANHWEKHKPIAALQKEFETSQNASKDEFFSRHIEKTYQKEAADKGERVVKILQITPLSIAEDMLNRLSECQRSPSYFASEERAECKAWSDIVGRYVAVSKASTK